MADKKIRLGDLTPPNNTHQVWKELADGSYAPQVHVVGSELDIEQVAYSTIACGELQGSATALQLPSVACKLVKFKARLNNAGAVYLGGASVTKPTGTTDVTTGLELNPGDDSGWLPVSNMDVFHRICDNAGDDLTYLAMVS